MSVLNLSRGHPHIKWLGPGRAGNTEYALQEGVIFCWSESNLQYERAWWLNEDGSTKVMQTPEGNQHVANILADRPFDPAWLAQ